MAAPTVFAMKPAAPNPFNPMTTISYELPQASRVTLMIYDVRGKLVRTLENQMRDAGRYDAVWDGKDDRGRTVASGIYHARMRAAHYNKVQKLTLLK